MLRMTNEHANFVFTSFVDSLVKNKTNYFDEINSPLTKYKNLYLEREAKENLVWPLLYILCHNPKINGLIHLLQFVYFLNCHGYTSALNNVRIIQSDNKILSITKINLNVNGLDRLNKPGKLCYTSPTGT